MRESLKLLLSIFVVLLVGGCSQKVTIKALSPAEVGDMAQKKKIAISRFTNDRFGISGKIESAIAKQKLDDKRYFTLVSRKDLNKVIAEQRFQSSEMLDEATVSRVGKLIGVQAIISGEMVSSSAVTDRHREERIRCVKFVKNKGCVRAESYQVLCRSIKASVSANINILDIESGLIIYGDAISKKYKHKSCYGNLISKTQALDKLASEIASEFVYKLTPHYIYFNVALLEDIELDSVTDNQEDRFENSLEYIEASRLDKAQKILDELLDELDGKSFVVAYVLGVVYEAQYNYVDAKKMYDLADSLTTKPVEEINKALIRIDKSIDDRQEAKEQLNVE